MKVFSQTLLALSLLGAFTTYAQTSQKPPAAKTATPVKKTTVKKSVSPPNSSGKAAAVAKAKEDSIASVNALAMQMARKIIMEDSIKKAQAAQQLAADEKLKQDQLRAEQQKTPEKGVKSKSKKEEVAKTKPEKKAKEPVKKVPDELKPIAKPEVAGDGPKTWIGLKGSGIAAFVVGKDIPDYTKPYFGYGGGLVANFGLGKHLSFQPEVLYAQEGFALKGTEDGIDLDVSFVLSGIQVPLLIKYSFGEHNKGFFINAGPYGTYLLNSKFKDKTPDGISSTYKPEKTTIEYGVAAGFGVAVPLGKGRLLLEARGNYFLGASGEELDLDDATLLTGVVSVGYLFPLGH